MKKLMLVVMACAMFAPDGCASESDALANELHVQLINCRKELETITAGPINTVIHIRKIAQNKWSEDREMVFENNVKKYFIETLRGYQRGLMLIDSLKFLTKEESKLDMLNCTVRPAVINVEIYLTNLKACLDDLFMPLSPRVDFYMRLANHYYLPDDPDFCEIKFARDKMIFTMKMHVNYLAILADEEEAMPEDARISDSSIRNIIETCGEIFMRPQSECWAMMCKLGSKPYPEAIKDNIKYSFKLATEDLESKVAAAQFYLPKSPLIREWAKEAERK